MLNKTNSDIFFLTKLRSLFQDNEKIGKISSDIPLILNRVIDLFLTDLLSQMVKIAKKKKPKKIKKKTFFLFIKKKKKGFKNKNCKIFFFFYQKTEHLHFF
mmetsp:Transcript_44111/g.88476  ORF Transcript_44111/g.88476 Transcript_44111/m.88476 type:complete len:101 (-) Transcript_44111:432-734(-)